MAVTSMAAIRSSFLVGAIKVWETSAFHENLTLNFDRFQSDMVLYKNMCSHACMY